MSLTKKELDKIDTVLSIDYSRLEKKTDKFRLNVDIKKIKTIDDLKFFMTDYKDYLSYLGKTQFELIIKEREWSKTIYVMLAAAKFKKNINNKISL